MNPVTYAKWNWIAQIADDASFIRVFITNHSMRWAMFNEISPLKLLVVADTSFASILVKNDEANKKKSAIPGY